MYKMNLLFFALVACVFMSGCGLFVNNLSEGEILSPTPNDHFVNINGVDYHYVEYPGEGTDVFLLHGFASSAYTWEGVAPYLNKKGYHVWAFDMKGFGWSDKPKKADYDAVSLMEDVNAFMDKMELKDVVFVGNSLGGAIAVLMELEHPERIDRLVLVDAAGYPMKMPLIVKMADIPFAKTSVNVIFGRWMIKWNLKEVYYHNDWVKKEQVKAYYDRLRTKNGLGAQVSLARAVDFNDLADYTARIPEIQARTLIIWGENDKWIPIELGYRFRKELTNSTLVVIPECGHIPQEEYPDKTAQIIDDFIKGNQIADTPIPEKGK
jgi:pimeloyl-ACP methyl ester carboxylesterase